MSLFHCPRKSWPMPWSRPHHMIQVPVCCPLRTTRNNRKSAHTCTRTPERARACALVATHQGGEMECEKLTRTEGVESRVAMR